MNISTTPPKTPAMPGSFQELSCERQNMTLDLEMPEIPAIVLGRAENPKPASEDGPAQEAAANTRQEKAGQSPEAPVVPENSMEKAQDEAPAGQEGNKESSGLAETTESAQPAQTAQPDLNAPLAESGETEKSLEEAPADQDQETSKAPVDDETGQAEAEEKEKENSVKEPRDEAAVEIKDNGGNRENGQNNQDKQNEINEINDKNDNLAENPADSHPQTFRQEKPETKQSENDRTPAAKENLTNSSPTAKEEAKSEDKDEAKKEEHKDEEQAGPVIQVLQKGEEMQIVLRPDVDLSKSILKWNNQPVEGSLLKPEAGVKNHLTYELRNEKGEVLESSEQFFPAGSEDQEKNPQGVKKQLGISSPFQYAYPATESHRNLKVTLDGIAVNPSSIHLTRENRLLRAEYQNEWNETVIEEIEIRPLGRIEQDLSRPASMVDENGWMKVTLDGDWQGMSLIMKSKDGQESWIPFESGCLQVRLNPGQSYEFSLSHALLSDQISWNLESGSWGDSSKEEDPGQSSEDKKEEAEKPSTAPSVPAPEKPKPPVQVEEGSASEDKPNDSFTTKEPASSAVLSKPLGDLKFEFSIDGITLQESQTFVLQEGSKESAAVENGTITQVEYTNSLSDGVYSSLEEAVAANPAGTIEAGFQVRDLWGAQKELSYSLIPPVREATGILEMNTGGVMNKFALDEDGTLNREAVEFASRPGMICKGLSEVEGQSIQAGDEIRIYLNIPQEEARILINDAELENPEFKTDELGLTYVSVLADREMDIDVLSTRTNRKSSAKISPEPEKKRQVTLKISTSLSPAQNLMQGVIGLLTGLFMEGKRRFGWPF